MAMRILVIGDPARPTSTILRRLASRGWGAQYVETLREAQNSLLTFQFDVVLSAESLADGRGYEVADLVMRRAGTLIVGVALSASCLWLPVVEQGARVLGSRALNAHMLESELEAILAARERAHEGESVAGTRISSDRAAPPEVLPRRKGASVGSA
jgi:DNA-binding response OmpR family regulator